MRAFRQLNCEEEKIQSFLERGDGTESTSWNGGARERFYVATEGRACSLGEGKDEWAGSGPSQFQTFPTFPADGNPSYKYKERKHHCY